MTTATPSEQLDDRTATRRRAGWSLADQGVSSGTNVVLSVIVARNVTAVEFGAFGLAFTVYLLLIGLTRAVTAEPLLVRTSASPDQHRRAQAAPALAVSLGIGLVAGIGCGAAAALTSGATRLALAALALGLPGLLLQDTERYVFFAAGRPRAALAIDLVWAVAQLALVGAALLVGLDDVFWLTLAWASSATIAAGVGLILARLGPDAGAARAWLHTQRDLVPGFVAEFGARNGGRYLTMFALTAFVGLDAMAGVRAAQVLFGPLNVVLLGVGLVAVPETVRLRHRHPERLGVTVHALAAGLGLLTLLGGLVLLAVPDAWGDALFGASWREAEPVLVPQALLFATMGVVTGYVAGLRALAAAGESLRARLLLLPASVVGGLAGVLLAGAPGAIGGLALVNGAGIWLWHHQFRRALRRAEPGAVPGPASATAPSPPPSAGTPSAPHPAS